METIETKKSGIENIPKREVYYYGPKMISCTEIRKVKHKDYIFELYQYDIKSNGKYFIKMFDSNGNQLFSRLTIVLAYNWIGYSIIIYNDFNKLSNMHLYFSASINYRFESVLNKFVLVADKMNKYKEASNQYAFAYMIYLFYQNHKNKINASSFSSEYNTLKKMKNLITRELSDNAHSTYFSDKTIYFKVFDRFIIRQLESLKSKEIFYD